MFLEYRHLIARLGAYACAKCDPRHVGTVVAIHGGVFIRLRFANGWKADYNVADLDLASADNY